MAKTTNYQFDLPNPRGMQIAEIENIANSLIAIDAELKASETALSTHKHSFEELIDRPTTLEGYGITDAMTAQDTVDAIRAAIDSVVNGSGAALDTLKELADALGNDPQFATTVGNALGNRVRVDAAQGLNQAQQTQGRANIAALGSSDRGKANGVASLDINTKVPVSQIPSLSYLPLAGGALSGLLEVRGFRVLAAGSNDNVDITLVDKGGVEQALFYYQSSTGKLRIRRPNGSGWRYWDFNADGSTEFPGGLDTSASITTGGEFKAGTMRITNDGNIFGSQWGNKWLKAYLEATFLPVSNPTVSGNLTCGALVTGGDGAGVSYNGYLTGPAWEDWGNGNKDAKVGIGNRIEARGAAYRDAAISSAQDWANGRFVQNVRLGSQVTISADSGMNYQAPTGHVVTFINSTGATSADNNEVDGVSCKPLQRNINGSWATVSG
ncbi:hypothetical protein [Brucella tritici]|uniref:Tail fibre protein gp37 trimerization region domain-containing protein n=1 Tax=Brucella tritici TaxID=94626 RepID=A0A6L3YVQ5_9HYPH|nr:hypothetical protein [Brucella tritici]KAB2689651.1 hypothetical protein F9L08_03050 [Brucella tritici]